MSVRDRTKGTRYIQQLDLARCDANWDAVPELVRKIKKHAPHRACLILTAESEYAIIQASQSRNSVSRPLTARPSTASANTPSKSAALARQVPILLEAIERDQTLAEDGFQARVCLGWIHWQLGEIALAAARLPKNIEQEFAQLDGTNKESTEWTKVCALKAAYIKGNSLQKGGAIPQALETFESSLPILTSFSSQMPSKELRSWTELFLTSACMLSSYAFKNKISHTLETETLSSFRAWAKFWDSQNSTPGGRAPQAQASRREVWGEYYVTLSDLLQQDLPFSTTSLTTTYVETSTRSVQRAELRRIEAKYEALLLSEIPFPKAEEASEEIESFVDIVMQNWRILCGNSWKEEDLGEGGSEAASREILNILYRAASKTFHSTAILRHLFTVHLAVAEFELAFKAFDTYMDIVKKGKARIEKTGEPEPNIDDDETVLKTGSECIKALCRYGSWQGAEKARDLGHYFEEWLDKHHPDHTQQENGRVVENGHATDGGNGVSPSTFALAWRYIGIGYAQWARLTFDASARSEIQLRAIRCFRQSLAPQLESTTEVETLFALGIILAERRELPAAIEVVKSGLQVRLGSSSQHCPFARERSLIPLWHLLALLLSARQEFLTAARACEGAFEQFRDPKNLFGEPETKEKYRSAHLNETDYERHRGVVDEMDDFEKEGVLEVKMTQLALVEVLEGPEIAVNASEELLGLYTRLFGGPQREVIPVVPESTTIVAPPKSSSGTIRSFKGSIFGRRSTRKIYTSGGESAPSLPRPRTAQPVLGSGAPTIQVNGENGKQEKLRKRSNSLSKSIGSIRNRSSSASRVRSLGSGKPPLSFSSPAIGGENARTLPNESRDGDHQLPHHTSGAAHSSYPPRTSSSAINGRRTSFSKPFTTASQQVAQKEKPPAPPAHQNLTLTLNNYMPQPIPYSTSKNPPTRFPRDQENRRRSTILLRVWLQISGFYRRATMYEDARGAVDEAHKLVQELETNIAKDVTGDFSIDREGWAGGKEIAALWGDVYSERGYLALAEKLPYVALTQFEQALTHLPDHPSATVGLSNILLDIYTEELLPPPSIPNLVLPTPTVGPSVSTINTMIAAQTPLATQPLPILQASPSLVPPTGPLGLPSSAQPLKRTTQIIPESSSGPNSPSSTLQPSYKESCTALLDRLAARDRAYGLLSALTKLGTGWNYSEAWFALARAYEEGGQLDKAKEVLWWCVELEEGRGVRDWRVVGSGGYVLST